MSWHFGLIFFYAHFFPLRYNNFMIIGYILDSTYFYENRWIYTFLSERQKKLHHRVQKSLFISTIKIKLTRSVLYYTDIIIAVRRNSREKMWRISILIRGANSSEWFLLFPVLTCLKVGKCVGSQVIVQTNEARPASDITTMDLMRPCRSNAPQQFVFFRAIGI